MNSEQSISNEVAQVIAHAILTDASDFTLADLQAYLYRRYEDDTTVATHRAIEAVTLEIANRREDACRI